ncbi:MAG: membrane protein insertion efficiency factor YidD [Abditibacteriota bacterium]|nr:membrane protein insertion efficiency factor YidD [Abditibacteriota bacterium]
MIFRRFLVLAIRRVYQPFSRRFLPPSCRFRPTCSEYTAQAIEKYGVMKGSFLGLKRILRCNPFGKGGDDPLV